MQAKLIGVPGSHPTLCAELMLRHKGIAYTRFDLPNMSHRYILPLMRYRASTVPVMKLDGRRVTTTMRIARALDAVQPEPPLFPAADRATVEGVEAWADGPLQDGVRQLGRWGAVHDHEAMATFLDGVRMGVPLGLVKGSLPVLRPVVGMQMGVSDDTARACAEALPGQIDRVDALLAEGVIGGEQPNAADFQIATSVRLAMCFDQFRDPIAARPAGAHAMRLCPDYPGRVRAVLPSAWIAWT
jgi:glutathione S-transferase